MIISDNGFDQLFGLDTKIATESMRRSQAAYFEEQLGILGPINSQDDGQRVGVESILSRVRGPVKGPQSLKINFSNHDKMFSDKFEMDISITDNPRITLLPHAYRRIAHENARTGLYGQLEQAAYEKPATPTGAAPYEVNQQFNDRQRDAAEKGFINLGDLNEAYKSTPKTQLYGNIPIISMDENNQIDYFECLLPAESTAPLVIGDDVRNPIGFLTIIDDMGNFINSRSSLYGDANFMNYLNNDGMTDSIINRSNLGLGNTSRITPEIANRLSARCSEIAENEFTRALSQALGGAEISMKITETFGRILLARHLAKRHTQVVYIPVNNLCYFATDFNEDGIGVSITERSFIISTVRMALLFATMNSSVLNSARHMQYDIELSPDDMNGQKTVDQVKSDILNSYNRRLPMWGDINDAWSMGANAGIAFNVTGNEYYASHKVSVSDTTPEYKVPDQQIDENLLRRTCHIACVDPDLVLTPENLEFASQIYSKSLLVTQQIVKKQEILSTPLTRYVTNSLQASPKLQAELIRIIVEYIRNQNPNVTSEDLTKQTSEYLAKFINGMKVTLPPPDTSASSSQADLFDKRYEFIETLADLVVTDDISNMLQNEGIEMQPDDLKTMIKSFYTRNWLRNQGIETDLFDLIYDEDKRGENVKMISDEIASASKTLIQLAKRATGKVETLAKAADLNPEDANNFGGGSDFGGGSEDDGGLGGDEDLGGDDLGGDEDLDMSDEETTETDTTS